jgi:nitrogen-specific signal transduction histidine kinase
MQAGAQDYLIKGQIENRALPRALRHAIERHRMQTETDLIRKQQMEFKDEFLSHVSHELRSPLNAIYQFATILQDGLSGELNPEQHQHLKIVLRNVKQLQSMINDLFEVTGVVSGKLTVELQRTSLSDAINYAVNTLEGAATAKGVTLSVDMEGPWPSVYADPTRIRQILVILIENAIKFTPPKGFVRVRIRIEDQTMLVFEVSDSGCGIAQDVIERIFERLFQVSNQPVDGRKGLGLGLYICKELVTRQGGKIWATSTPGKGSTFSVKLPVFCLFDLIGPVLRRKRRIDIPVTLVITEIGSQTGWFSEQVRAGQSQEVRDVLQRCLHSDLDVLLPKISSAGSVELFFIVASTDEIGGKAITKRIQEQLDGSGQIQRAALTVSTTYRSIEATAPNASESTEDALEKTSDRIQELMDEEISLRMVANGQ